jgi:hypothetical protein
MEGRTLEDGLEDGIGLPIDMKPHQQLHSS